MRTRVRGLRPKRADRGTKRGGPPPHFHDRSDELLYVLDGTFEVIAGNPNEWQVAETGTIIHVPAGTIHTT